MILSGILPESIKLKIISLLYSVPQQNGTEWFNFAHKDCHVNTKFSRKSANARQLLGHYESIRLRFLKKDHYIQVNLFEKLRLVVIDLYPAFCLTNHFSPTQQLCFGSHILPPTNTRMCFYMAGKLKWPIKLTVTVT